MTLRRSGPTVLGLNLRHLPPIGGARPGSGAPFALRVVGLVSLAVIFISVVAVEPRPGRDGDGPLVLLGLVLLAGGIAGSLPRRDMPDGLRLAGLLTAAAGACVLAGVQPDSAGFAGIYYVVVISGMRFPGRLGVAVAGVALGAMVAVMALTPGVKSGSIAGLVFSVVPWFLVMRLVRRLLERGREAEALVEELRESRAAHAESVALAERG